MTTNPQPSRAPTMTCRDVLDFIMAYLDGELAPGQRQEFERHLGVCPSCVNYVQSYRETVRIGKAAMLNLEEPASGSVPESLIRAILAARLKGV